MSPSPVPAQVPVLIVGAGPSGSMAALLLEQLGVETLVAERRAGAQRAPAAHVVNARTFEICRAAGVDMKAIADAAQTPEDAGFTYFVTKLGGRVLGRLPFEQQGDDQLAVTPTPLRNFSQNHFEPILHEALARASGRAPHWQLQWESAVDGGDRVRSTLRDLETDTLHEITSEYLIAADGAGSRVRKAVGIDVHGPERIRSFVMMHLRGALRGLPEVPPGVLFFCNDPETLGGVFVIHDLDDEATYMHPFDPDTESLDQYDTARCETIVRTALEDPEDYAFSVETVGTWTMTAQVAERYRAGRIFLVGDSAHRFPPTGGLGLNSGTQDAHNLAWKIAFVRAGRAPDSLLDSYEGERRPIAQTNADQSLRNAIKLIEVPQALGIDGDVEASKVRMDAILADPEGVVRVEAAVANQAEHFDMPGLQLGFCYAEGALVRGPGDEAQEVSVRDFTPSGAPGCRVPHAWLDGEHGRSALLDHVPPDRFLLIAGPLGKPWLDALATLDAALVAGLTMARGTVVALDTWLACAGIDPEGALLVRPDHHVAWRAPTAAPDPARALATALNAVLGS